MLVHQRVIIIQPDGDDLKEPEMVQKMGILDTWNMVIWMG